MHVIFLEDVPDKAHAGEVVKVADGLHQQGGTMEP